MNLYNNLNKKVFWLTLSVTIILLVSSFLVPPMGIIDSSVILGCSELFAFATLATVIEAIEKGRHVSIRKGETEVDVASTDEDSL